MGRVASVAGIVSDEVSKSFGSVPVLRRVSFEAPAGQATLLAGRNGAGKTTWIRVALGLAGADSGRVHFGRGRSVDQVRGGVAIVPDEPSVYPALNGHANLRLLSGIRTADPQNLDRIREMLGLDDAFLAMRASGYSLGQRRRLAIAAALLREPRYLFCDEPTIGLDPVAWVAVREALRDLLDRGAAVLITGQDFTALESLCDQVALLRDGAIAFEGDVETFLSRRASRVRVVVPDAAALASRLDRQRMVRDRETVDIPCTDAEDARALMEWIRSSDVVFSSLSVERDSLEEAFLAIHSEREGASDATVC